MMKSILTLIVLAGAGVFAASSGAPSVGAIERAFNLRAGMSFPIVAADGQHYRLEYRGLEVRSHGEYAIVVKLER